MLCLFSIWKKTNIYDNPSFRSSHKMPTPTAAGCIFVVGFLGNSIIACNLFNEIPNLFMLSSIAILSIVGFYDDIAEVPWFLRLSLQIVCICLCLYTYNFDMVTLVVWLLAGVAIINAMNFLDGINTFSAGLSLFSLIFLISFCDLQVPMAILLLPMYLVVYLAYNVSGKIFMGDVGSTFLGLIIFILTLKIQQHLPYPSLLFEGDKALFLTGALLLPAWADVLSTLWLRVKTGRSLFEPARDYYFQRLSDTYKPYNVLLLYLFLCCLSVLLLIVPLAFNWPWLLPLSLGPTFLLALVILRDHFS